MRFVPGYRNDTPVETRRNIFPSKHLSGGREGRKSPDGRPRTLGADARWLNNVGEVIASNMPYKLVRTGEVLHISGLTRMSGMYRYMADAAIFEECRTRVLYPVVFEEAHIELERAYLKAQEEPGQPVMVAFDGRIELRPKMEGEGDRAFVVVGTFDKLFPDERCFDDEPRLDGAFWSLIELNGYPIESLDRTDTPHIVFISEDTQVAGSGGCNRFTGNYEMSGDSLSFGPLASTTMACPRSMDQETVFQQALGATTNFDLYGNVLELWSDGRFVARFEGGELVDEDD